MDTRLLIQNKRGGPSVNPLLGIIRRRQHWRVKPQPTDLMNKYFGSKS